MWQRSHKTRVPHEMRMVACAQDAKEAADLKLDAEKINFYALVPCLLIPIM